MDGSTKQISDFRRFVTILLPILFIGAGIGGFFYLKSKKVKIARTPSKKQVVSVEIKTMHPGDHQSTIKVLGTVRADQQISLRAKVSGEVVWASPEFVQGGLVKKGRVILQIEDADYQVQFQKAQSALDKAVSDLEIELGSQIIAQEEFELIRQSEIGDIKTSDLALRKPQLAKAEAAVKTARADFEQARLNLERTKIKVPFNCLITGKSVNQGSLVSTQSELAVLVNTDVYRVEALVPPDRLSALTLGEGSGSKAVIHSQYSGHTWHGRVVRTTGKLASDSRMAGVIILVADPLGQKNKNRAESLLLEDYVEIEIFGQVFNNVFLLQRNLLRDGESIWVYNEGKLEIRKPGIVWKEDGTVFIDSGLKPGDKVITSDIPVPVNGMELQMIVKGDS